MMKRIFAISLMLVFALTVCSVADTYYVKYDFETSWTTDYAPGWENTSYRHGTAPVGKMMEQVSGGYTGNGMQLIADSVPEDWMWWAGVSPISVDAMAMMKQFDPWISVMYYDAGSSANVDDPAGQMFAVPSWVNPYITGGEDWTDIQFGARDNVEDNYYFVACGESNPGWINTGIARSTGWHQLKMHLSSIDGKVHFYVDGTEVGTSWRNDYIDLGTEIGLYTRFAAPLSDWYPNPSTVWDDFEFGSTYVPVPGGFLLGSIGIGFAGWLCRRKKS